MRYLPLCELVEISPTIRLEKGVEYPFVPMEDITPGRRYVQAHQNRVATGGAKFGHGDTLFARITPCLENGKIAQFLSVPGQIAFGSTEYWVFRARPKISDPAFIFYLSSSDILRKPAEKSMAGASGRQRADIAAVKNIKVPAPVLVIQQRIASILSAYDDLIENNIRRIAVLEEMTRRLYEEWFVHFRFPGHEQVRMVESELGLIPEGWEARRLGDVAKIQWGDTRLTKAAYVSDGYTAYSASGPDGFLGHFQRNGLGIVLSAIGAQCGKTWFARGHWGCIKNTISLWSANDEIVSNEFLFLQCYGESYWPRRGAAQPFVSLGDARGCPVLLPSITLMEKFTSAASPMLSLTSSLSRTNKNFRAQRDLLLPKLISGEIDVSAFPIEIVLEN